jgi:hypothetical protein
MVEGGVGAAAIKEAAGANAGGVVNADDLARSVDAEGSSAAGSPMGSLSAV